MPPSLDLVHLGSMNAGSFASFNPLLRQTGTKLDASNQSIQGSTRGLVATSPVIGSVPGSSDAISLPSPVRTADLPRVQGPAARLDALGTFKGFVQTPKGDVFIAVHPATEEGQKHPPMVYLGGLATWGDRVDEVSRALRDGTGRAVIGVVMPGQAETLDRDVSRTGGKSLQDGITDADQARSVLQVLDTLGIQGPVDMAGLSYGGAVVAAVSRDAPERLNNGFLIAPHVRSVARFDGREALWQLANSNPLGQLSYRVASQALLNSTFGLLSTFREHPAQFLKGVGELTAGIDRLQLEKTIAGRKNMHAFVAAADPISPPSFNRLAIDAAGPGSTFTLAPARLTGQHDLTENGLPEITGWMRSIFNRQQTQQAGAKEGRP